MVTSVQRKRKVPRLLRDFRFAPVTLARDDSSVVSENLLLCRGEVWEPLGGEVATLRIIVSLSRPNFPSEIERPGILIHRKK